MEKLSTVLKHEKRSQKSSKKKQVKVVYISNPMKIKATPSEFRAVVQQLTGKYATSPPPQALTKDVNKHDDVEVGGDSSFLNHQEKLQISNRNSVDAPNLYDESICGDDDDQVMDNLITSQMFEGFSSLLPRP